jgi:PPM family protein phosphatase
VTVLRSGSATDVGRVRTVNQDLPLERPNLYAVADGMGGHVGGEVAARVAVETLERAFERAPSSEGLRRAFSEANTAVWEQSQTDADLRGMGTTLTAMALVGGTGGGDVLALANVGDSRAYVFSEGQLAQVTDDHSLAEERMRHGEMTEAEAAVHPQRHILTRALGVSPEVDADMWQLELRSGDRVLLCSDGLSNEVGTDEMADILAEVGDPEEAAQRLVAAANEHGGADNITVVVVDVQIGEDGENAASRVTPLGLQAAAVTVPAAAATTGAVAAGVEAGEPASAPEPAPEEAGPGSPPAAPMAAAGRPAPRPDDTLAPGSRLAFGDEPATLAESGPRSDEFFLGTGPVPVARSSSRVPPPPPPPGGERPSGKETRGQRRRRLGIPRRITPRVVGFVLLVAAVPVAAYFVLRWYAYDNWIVTLQGNQVVVKQGQPGGVLWFHPRVVDRTGLTTSELDPAALAPLKAGIQKGSLRDAQHYVTTITTTPTITTTTTTPGHATSPSGSVSATTTTARTTSTSAP